MRHLGVARRRPERRIASSSASGYHGCVHLEGLLVDLDGMLYVGNELEVTPNPPCEWG
jgi:hypothetical protein